MREFWRHLERLEQRESNYQQQANGIQEKLYRGTRLIKEGHKVAVLNPEGQLAEVSLSVRQKERLEFNLRVLQGKLDEINGLKVSGLLR